MAVKVLMTWNIKPDKEQEYFEFVIGDFIPGLQHLGFQPVDAWATIYGDYPQIQVGVMTPNLQDAERILQSEGWQTLREQLFNYVSDFSYKIVPARRGFQF